MLDRNRMIAAAGAALTLALLTSQPAEAVTYRSGACPTWACGSATVTEWGHNGIKWEIHVRASVKDTLRDGKSAYGKIRYYTSATCGFQDGDGRVRSGGDGTGVYTDPPFEKPRVQASVVGIRFILRDQTTTGGKTAYGGWVDNPKMGGNPNCAP